MNDRLPSPFTELVAAQYAAEGMYHHSYRHHLIVYVGKTSDPFTICNPARGCHHALEMEVEGKRHAMRLYGHLPDLSGLNSLTRIHPSSGPGRSFQILF